MRESKCKGCGRKVVFAIDEQGNNQILDAVAPVYQITEPGNPENETRILCVRARTAYVSHFVTCPQRHLFGKGSTKQG